MQLLPIKRATLVEKLVAEVRSEITSRRLVVGQRLPTEAKMASQFGVSRPLLREALAELRAEGFVQTESGRGTFVRHPTETDLADAFGHQLMLAAPGPGPTADQLYEARQAIEVVAAELAAERATPESLATLERLLATMRESRADAAAYTAADVGFHIAVARATQNPLLPTLLAPLATLIVEGMYESHSTPDATSQGIAAHTKVLRALKKRDGAAARRAMAAHLRESRRVFPEQVVRRHGGSR
ncbi:MAG TPA: FCD domain-containing protein [Acidimicrobiales bacterium]|nr:FCD domain-containing protein [Acidimicrobiales bacterium]